MAPILNDHMQNMAAVERGDQSSRKVHSRFLGGGGTQQSHPCFFLRNVVRSVRALVFMRNVGG